MYLGRLLSDELLLKQIKECNFTRRGFSLGPARQGETLRQAGFAESKDRSDKVLYPSRHFLRFLRYLLLRISSPRHFTKESDGNEREPQKGFFLSAMAFCWNSR